MRFLEFGEVDTATGTRPGQQNVTGHKEKYRNQPEFYTAGCRIYGDQTRMG
jgi:hypothetical protein